MVTTLWSVDSNEGKVICKLILALYKYVDVIIHWSLGKFILIFQGH